MKITSRSIALRPEPLSQVPTMRMLMITLLSMAVFAVNDAGAARADDPEPLTPSDSQPADDAASNDNSARPEWTNPNQSDDPVGVDDDPTPFDPGTFPPDPDQ